MAMKDAFWLESSEVSSVPMLAEFPLFLPFPLQFFGRWPSRPPPLLQQSFAIWPLAPQLKHPSLVFVDLLYRLFFANSADDSVPDSPAFSFRRRYSSSIRATNSCELTVTGPAGPAEDESTLLPTVVVNLPLFAARYELVNESHDSGREVINAMRNSWSDTRLLSMFSCSCIERSSVMWAAMSSPSAAIVRYSLRRYDMIPS